MKVYENTNTRYQYFQISLYYLVVKRERFLFRFSSILESVLMSFKVKLKELSDSVSRCSQVDTMKLVWERTVSKSKEVALSFPENQRSNSTELRKPN